MQMRVEFPRVAGCYTAALNPSCTAQRSEIVLEAATSSQRLGLDGSDRRDAVPQSGESPAGGDPLSGPAPDGDEGQCEGVCGSHQDLAAVCLGPDREPPPPTRADLPSEDENSSSSPSAFPGIGRRELARLKDAVWTEVTTEAVPEAARPVFSYNTPLPFHDQDASSAMNGGQGSHQHHHHSRTQNDYASNVTAYQEYLQYYYQMSPEDPAYRDYVAQYAAWWVQSTPHVASSVPMSHIRQKSFEELLEQDRQLSDLCKTPNANEYVCQRSAFKSSFRGTKTYREHNKGYNPKHFNQLSQGAETYAKTFPKEKTALVDRD